jgi:hypothetical protein
VSPFSPAGPVAPTAPVLPVSPFRPFLTHVLVAPLTITTPSHVGSAASTVTPAPLVKHELNAAAVAGLASSAISSYPSRPLVPLHARVATPTPGLPLVTHELNAAGFVALVRRYTAGFEELTPELVREFIDKVVVFHREKVQGVEEQQVDIYYKLVGKVDVPLLTKPQMDRLRESFGRRQDDRQSRHDRRERHAA